MSWDSETSKKIREARELMRKAKALLVEAQSTANWDDLKDSYQDKVYQAVKQLRDIETVL